jgi:hypothetical protein
VFGSASARASRSNSDALLKPNCFVELPKWTLRKFDGSPKSAIHPNRYSSA